MSVGCNELALAGPLVGLSKGLADALVRQGYAPRTVLEQKKLLGDLSDWLQARARAKARGLTAGDLTSGQVDRFFGARRSAGITRHKTRMALTSDPGLSAGIGGRAALRGGCGRCPGKCRSGPIPAISAGRAFAGVGYG